MSNQYFHRRDILKTVLSAPALILTTSVSRASSAPTKRDPLPVFSRQIHSGHSLTDAAIWMGEGWPDKHYAKLLKTLGRGKPNIARSTVPGSTMLYRQENEPEGGWNDIADYEAIIITERNDTYPFSVYEDKYKWINEIRAERRQTMTDWFKRSQKIGNNGQGSEFFYYTPWPGHSNYTRPDEKHVYIPKNWRDRLLHDEVEHLDVASAAERNVGSDGKIWIVPGNAMMMRIYDDAEAGKVPGIADGEAFLTSPDWWGDDVHPTGFGSLALAYLHMYVVHHVDPRGKVYARIDLDPAPNSEQATYIQEMIYDLIQNYPRAGVV
ncbi:hypothetical protein SAMN05444358_102137 [Ruegeria halocynthiae]|uniref:Uncharacterized protein n=1 Tax=Ruegeria halocynthiae TaxID=985054 RepID=A0A1H2Y2H9_9RHOB|nr:hypothetical protein [Ruegeria halocynthiae]SDW99165.1 hypothetical protein SAMN05444358_102137 [Ruegeria halocynthiae]